MSTTCQKSAPVRSSLLTKQKRGTLVLVGLAPDRLGLRLHAGNAVEDDDRAVEHAQAALDLDREIHVAGRVDQVDAMVLPEAGRGGGGDGDPPLLLLLHPVHRRGALVHLADLVDLLGVEEDPLGHGRLARVDVRDDPDVAGALERDPSLALTGPPAAWVMVICLPLEMAEGPLASAIRWVSSRRFTAAPMPLPASMNSAASFSAMLRPFRLRAASMQPAHAQRDAAVGADLDRDLVGGAADALGLDLDERHRVAQGKLHHLDPGAAGLLLAAGDGVLAGCARRAGACRRA